MNWGDMGLLALKNALRSRQKTFFCALAVCVGIASVYMICEISRNARDQITQQVEQSGLSGIMVFGKEEQGMMAAEEIRALPQSVPGLKAAMPLFSQYGSCKLREEKRNMLLWGVDEQFSSIFHVQVKYGRLPSQEDVRLCQKVAVIEDTMALEAYGRENVVGKEIWISTDQLTESYQIIGVIASQKSGVSALIGENTLPAFVYVPYTTANLFSGVSSTNQLALAAQDEADAEAVTAFALDQLSRQTDGASFKAENVSGYIDTFSSILQTVSLLITAIGGIGLLVGGIGVMNSMTAAVGKPEKGDRHLSGHRRPKEGHHRKLSHGGGDRLLAGRSGRRAAGLGLVVYRRETPGNPGAISLGIFIAGRRCCRILRDSIWDFARPQSRRHASH